MRLQHSPEKGLCLVTSFAMALELPAQELLDMLGEGWKSLAFPNLPIPYCWRGVHIQELIQLALVHGYAVTPIELMPQVAPPQGINPVTREPYLDVLVFYNGTEESNWDVFNRTIMNCSGIITGEIGLGRLRLHRGHAVAFERGVIFDPDGEAYMYSANQCETKHFYVNCAWRFDKMEVTYAYRDTRG